MINLEQVQLLEAKVFKAIDYIELLTIENTSLRQKEAELQAKVESYQKQIDDLEGLVMRFKEDQSRIEDSILAALDRLNQFEEAIEKSLRGTPIDHIGDKVADMVDDIRPSADAQPAAEEEQDNLLETDQEHFATLLEADDPDEGQIYFEIPQTEIGETIYDTLTGTQDEKPQAKGGELDIF